MSLVVVLLLMLQVSSTLSQCTSKYCGEEDAGRTQWNEESEASRKMMAIIKELTENVARLEANVSRLNLELPKAEHIYSDCQDYLRHGYRRNGIIRIPTSYPGTFKKVYCDMLTDNGGWLVIQRRQDGSVNFTQDWAAYAAGFGDLEGEFWIGNRFLNHLTSMKPHELYIELQAFNGTQRWAKYSFFKVDDEDNKFRLTATGYTGNAGGNGLKSTNGYRFSTFDQDNDVLVNESCALLHDQGSGGGWWYGHCRWANLNSGRYGLDATGGGGGINWIDWLGYKPLMATEMKIRPLN